MYIYTYEINLNKIDCISLPNSVTSFFKAKEEKKTDNPNDF